MPSARGKIVVEHVADLGHKATHIGVVPERALESCTPARSSIEHHILAQNGVQGLDPLTLRRRLHKPKQRACLLRKCSVRRLEACLLYTSPSPQDS